MLNVSQFEENVYITGISDVRFYNKIIILYTVDYRYQLEIIKVYTFHIKMKLFFSV